MANKEREQDILVKLAHRNKTDKDNVAQTNLKSPLPSQDVPFPENPCLQVQLYEPILLAHMAFLSQGFVSAEHSSMSNDAKRKIKRNDFTTL